MPNPVAIEFGPGSIAKLESGLANRGALLVTSPGSSQRGWLDRIRTIAPSIGSVLTHVQPNPTFEHLRELYPKAWEEDFDVIVALGGGSVLDVGKILSVGHLSGQFSDLEEAIRTSRMGEIHCRVPLIAVPTTSGTGSEVTPWATLWDFEEKKKYSLHLPDLFPERCICDPELTISAPRDLTIQTGLDALSHCLESIWNKNATKESIALAVPAARLILETLPRLAGELSNINLREQMQRAALDAGLAISITQTALAHAISYYITAHRGVPHGIACSFTLPAIVDAVIHQDDQIDSALREILGTLSSAGLRQMFKKLQISNQFSAYGVDAGDRKLILDGLKDVARARNSLVKPESILRPC